MTRPVLISIAILLFAFSIDAWQTRGHMPVPPEPMNPDKAKTVPAGATLPRHVDLAALQQEADDLARTAQTIPTDVANVRRGTLPKDMIQKLKQIEKLSKHLRSELTQ